MSCPAPRIGNQILPFVVDLSPALFQDSKLLAWPGGRHGAYEDVLSVDQYVSYPGLKSCHFRGKATWPLVLSIVLEHKGQKSGQEGHQIKHDISPLKECVEFKG